MADNGLVSSLLMQQAGLPANMPMPGSNAPDSEDDTPSLTPVQVQQMIADKAKVIGVPPNIALSLAQHESGFDPDAESQDNGKGRGTAKGVYQLIDSTAKGLGVSDSFDPEQNITAALTNLRSNYDHFGSWDLALAAHHAGAGAVANAGGIPGGGDANISTKDYVNNILGSASGGAQDSNPEPSQPPSFVGSLILQANGGGMPAPQPDDGGPQPSFIGSLLLNQNAPAAPNPVGPPSATTGDVLTGLRNALGRSMFNTVNGLQTAYADATGDKAGSDAAIYDRQLANQLPSDDPHFNTKIGNMLYQGAAGAATAAPALVGTAAATILGTPVAGAAVGATLFGAQSGGEEYGAIRARGGSGGQAALGGTLDAGIAAGTSYLPMGFLTKKLGQVGVGEFVSGLVARDVPTMVAQSIANDMVDTSIANPNRTWGDFVHDLPGNVAQAAVSALVFASGAGAVHGAMRGAMRAAMGKPASEPIPTADNMSLVPEGQETPIAPPNGNVDVVDSINKATNVDDAIAAYQAAQPKAVAPEATPTVDMDTVNKTVAAIDEQHPANDPVPQAQELFKTPEWQAHRDAQPDDIRGSMIDAEQAINSASMPDDIKTMIADGVMDYANNTPREGMPDPVNNEDAKEPIIPERETIAPKPDVINPIVAHALDETEAEKPPVESTESQGEIAYTYPGMYKKGMTERNARNEAARRNRTDPELVHTAEPVAGLENPYQVVGRERVAPEPDVLHDINSVDESTATALQNAAVERSKEPYENAEIQGRGADDALAALKQAQEEGHISGDGAKMASWFIEKNPKLLNNMGLDVRDSAERGVSGQYDPLRRVATLFKGGDKSTTAVHEMLHHMERLMPEDTQLAIRQEYLDQIAHEVKTGSPEMVDYLDKVTSGKAKDLQDAAAMLQSGKVPIDAYKYMNPSEFWAVNMTRILENRYRAGDSGIWAKSKQWLSEAVQHIKGALGLRSDAPMLKEMNRLLSKGDGTFVNRSMLSDGTEKFQDISPEKEKKSIYTHLDPREIVHGYSPYVGVEMSKLPKGSVKEAVQTAFAPASKAAGKAAANVIRANLGEQAYQREQALTKLQEFAKMFDKFSPEDNYKFISDIENGRVIDNPRLNEAAVALRGILDSYRDRVRSLGTGALDNFITNYFPHIYKDAGKAEAFFKGVLSKRSLEGGKGFLKQRKYDSLADAMKPVEEGGGGLTPITDNPVEMTLLKLREMDRYIYGQKIFAELKAGGLIKFYRPGQAPDGMVKVNDKIGNINSPAAEGGMIHRGDYYAPQEAATVINNHLSPGLAGNGFYDAIRGVGNAMSTAQLAFSLYHVGFTTLDAIVSKNALAMMQFRRGDVVQGAKNLFMGTIGAPLTPILNAMQGDRLLKAYRGDISDPALAPMVEALQAAGARQRDDLYRNTAVNAFKQAARAGRYGEAAWKAIPTMLDYMNKPVFEYLVPRQKFGVFFDMAQDAIRANPNMDMATKRAVFGKIWDSVDNRMGELVYDNVFWNRALKDGLMAITRSVGWNLGTFRELGGGVLDAKSIFKDKSLSPRTAYVLALPFTTAIIGSAIQYLYTGQGPQDLKDCFFPRDGGVELDGTTPTRKSLPSYVKDVAEYEHDAEGFVKYGSDPLHTIKNKLSPSLSTISQMLNNEDYYGGAIRSPGDSAVQQAHDVASYLSKQILPFSVRNFQNQPKGGAAGGGIPGYVTSASFYGLSPAPGYITKSAADQESQEVAKDAPALMKKFRESIKENGIQDDTLSRMIAAGLTPEQRKLILRNSSGQYHTFKPRQFNPQGT